MSFLKLEPIDGANRSVALYTRRRETGKNDGVLKAKRSKRDSGGMVRMISVDSTRVAFRDV